MESPTMFGNGPDNHTYFEHLSKLENLLESASFRESDLTQGLLLAMDSIIRNTTKFRERTIYVLSDMKRSNFSTGLVEKIQQKSSSLKIDFRTVSEEQVPTPFGNSVPIAQILENGGFSRKIVQRRNTKFPFYLFNSADDTQLEMKIQTLGKLDRSKLG